MPLSITALEPTVWTRRGETLGLPRCVEVSIVSQGNSIAVWGNEGSVITDPANIEKIRQSFEAKGDLIVRHWFLYGGSAPDRMVFTDFEEFEAYLREKVRPGDAVDVWSFEDVCRWDNVLVEGKKPDAEGRVPKGGAY